jgi:hypothetical protein
VIQDSEGRVHTGIVTQRDEKRVRLLTNPLDNTPRAPLEVPLEKIEQETESKISLMPAGLLNTLTRDEILDLLAYVISNGNPRHAAFAG